MWKAGTKRTYQLFVQQLNEEMKQRHFYSYYFLAVYIYTLKNHFSF